MTMTQAVISGAVQGITEFFPISSSGHLVILHHLFGLREPQVAFDIFLHLGTLGAIFVFFRSDIAALFGKKNKLAVPVVLATAVTFTIAFIFKDKFERCFDMPKVVGYMLIVTGAWLIAATLYSRRAGKREKKSEPGMLSSLLVGIAQGIAVMPGISRSGATIATGMLAGLSREAAFRFSFLLAVPAILGACLFKAHKIGSHFAAADAPQFAIGAATAMMVGLVSIKALLELVKGNKLHFFGIYCFFAGLLTIMLA